MCKTSSPKTFRNIPRPTLKIKRLPANSHTHIAFKNVQVAHKCIYVYIYTLEEMSHTSSIISYRAALEERKRRRARAARARKSWDSLVKVLAPAQFSRERDSCIIRANARRLSRNFFSALAPRHCVCPPAERELAITQESDSWNHYIELHTLFSYIFFILFSACV